ncbi:hypothetical protein ACUIJN_11975 [Metabacillus halosaccharovorans]|uniref:hypothetical protein n=1 Tax=Metabacillus halosaccharovorans TaxID=930124 RepID=UPI00403DA014
MAIQESKYLLEKSKIILDDIQESYKVYIDSKDVPLELKDKIKEFLGKVYSSLEYQAFDIFTRYCKQHVDIDKLQRAESKVYFPNKDFEPAFEKYVKERFPKLNDSRPDIVLLIKSVQPFRDNPKQWLKYLNTLNNANKHRNLSKQHTVKTTYIKKGQLGGLTFGNNIFVNVDTPIIYNGTPIDFINPSPYNNNFDTQVHFEFFFNEINKPVLSILTEIYNGANLFINELESIL